MPTNTSALSVISSHFEKFASCPVPKQHSQPSRLSSGSIGDNNGIDLHLSANAKLVLMTKIEFHKAETATSTAFNDSLKTKYVNLSQLVPSPATSNGGLTNGTINHLNGNGKSPGTSEKFSLVNHLKTPPNGNNNNVNDEENKEASTSSSNTAVQQKRVLYPPERVQLKWCRPVPIGAGLVNCGNTCFLNSTLQALTHTAPLYNYIVSEQHIQNCKMTSFCMLCEMERHMVRTYGSNSTRAIEPDSILRKLSVIAKHLRLGRQEDAHEFLRFAVEKMQQACLNGHQKLDPEVKETTAMNAIFGGSIKSTVICQTCHTRSDKIDPIMDLCLELKQASTLQQALEHFVRPETLVGENAYKCPSCKKPQPARKMLSINRAPNILTFQLKRFGVGFSLFGGAKITKQIEFHERFNMRNFMSVKTGPEIPYSLYAVVVHEGLSANSGHYYAYVKHCNQWYVMNDTVVKSVSVRQVLSSQAYILFYVRDLEPSESSSSNSLSSSSISTTTPPNKKFAQPTSASKLVTPPVSFKPATIPSSAPPIKMVIRLPQQNGGTGTPQSSAPKITSYSSQPLVTKRPAQTLPTPATNTPTQPCGGIGTTPVKVAVPTTISSPPAVSKPLPASVVTASRPLIDGFETSSSDDEDNNRLVIDELAPGGGPSSSSNTTSLSNSFSKPPPERQKSPPVIKFIPPKPIVVPETKQAEPEPEASVESSEPQVEDGEVEEGQETSISSSSSKKRRKHRSEENGEEEDEEAGGHHHHHRRHKKHRHSRKRKHDGDEVGEVDEEGQGEQQTLENGEEKSKKKSKKHRRRSEGEESGEKNDDEGEEWVEKETPAEPPVQQNHLPEPVAPASFPLPPSYPGSNQSILGVSYALGSHVTSWDGGLNSIDSQLVNGNHGHNQPYDGNDRWKRDFDDDLDVGRVKKTRNNNKPFSAKDDFDSAQARLPAVFQQNNYGSGNAFQAIQNARNTNEREGSAPRSHGSGSRRTSGASSPDGHALTNGSGHNNNNNNNGYNNNQPRYPPQSHNNNGHQMNNNGNGHYYNNNFGDGGYQQPNFDKFSRLNNNNNNDSHHFNQQPHPNNNNNGNRFDSTPPQSNGFRKDNNNSYHHPASAPRTYGGNSNNNNNSNHNNYNNWRGGGGGGVHRGNGRDFYRRQYSLPFQQ